MMASDDIGDDYAGFMDDIREYLDDIRAGLQWLPILAKLKTLDQATEMVPRLKSIQDIAAFAIKTGLKEDPYKNRAFLIVCKLISTVENDKQWQAILKDVLK